MFKLNVTTYIKKEMGNISNNKYPRPRSLASSNIVIKFFYESFLNIN